MKTNKNQTKRSTAAKSSINIRNLQQELDVPQGGDDRVARLSIDLLAEDHKRLKMAATIMQMSMKDFVIMSVGDFMQRKMNRLTKNAK